jgi:multidrug efflux system outer membrane protein
LGRTTQQVENLPHKAFSDYQLTSTLETGVPSQLLLRRPDILAAEDRLAAAKIDVSVARKEFLPSFTLTGQFGYASAGYSRLFQWDSYLAALVAGATQNLFTGGQKVANLKVYKARYEQAVHHYQQTILQSYKDVDDSLALYKSDRRTYVDNLDALKTYESRMMILNNRIQAGVNAESDLVPVQLDAANTRSQLTQAKLAALNDTLSLYKSIGGGY